MNNKELAKLHAIDELWQNMKQEPIGRIVRGGVENPDGHRFVRNANRMVDEILSLYDLFSPDYFIPNLAGINSTLQDEVQRVQHAQKTYSIRATQSNRNNLTNEMNNVIEHFSRDFFEVLDKIQELKSHGEWE